MEMLSMEGEKVFTHRILLGFFSDTVRDLCLGIPTSETVSMSVPASKPSLDCLLSVLLTGTVLTTNREQLLGVTETAECLGIKLADVQIGVKSDKKVETQKEKIKKKNVSRRERKKKHNTGESTMNGHNVSESSNDSMEETISKDDKNTKEEEIKNNKLSKRGRKKKTKSDGKAIKKESESGCDDQDLDKIDGTESIHENVSEHENGLVKVELDYNQSDAEAQVKSSKKDKFHECLECGKSFSNNPGLRQHKTVHTGEKPFKCDQCERSFGQKGALLNHKVLHSGEQPFKCEHCDKGFTQKGNMKTHMMKVHSGMEHCIETMQ